jgi:hypothetical protein
MRPFTKVLTSALVLALSTQGINARQGNIPPPGQGQAAQAQNRADAANKAMFGQINQNAFFMDSAIRAQLNVNAQQADLLNRQYAQLWNVYNKTQSQFNNTPNLTDAQRQSMIQARNQFYSGLYRSSNDILDANQRARFAQLGLQYRGYQAFDDPIVTERLNLTNDQIIRLRRYEQDYDQQLATVYKLRATDATAFPEKFRELRREMNERINSVFTEPQRRVWKELYGDPHNFRIQ